MRTHMPLSFAVVVAMLGLAVPAAGADLYKWVDERGVTNYAGKPPASGQAVKMTAAVEDRLSVYTPDPQLARAIEAERTRAIEDLRTGRRSRDIQSDWLARQYLAAVERSYAPDPCLGGADSRCAEPYAPGAVFVPGRPDHRPLPQARLTPGTTAGHVTASTGYIPAQSAFAPPVRLRPERRALEGPRRNGPDGAARSRGGRTR